MVWINFPELVDLFIYIGTILLLKRGRVVKLVNEV